MHYGSAWQQKIEWINKCSQVETKWDKWKQNFSICIEILHYAPILHKMAALLKSHSLSYDYINFVHHENVCWTGVDARAMVAANQDYCSISHKRDPHLLRCPLLNPLHFCLIISCEGNESKKGIAFIVILLSPAKTNNWIALMLHSVCDLKC